MSDKTSVSRRCIVIHGVPGDISQTSLRQEIKRQNDVNVVRIEEIQGAETNRKLKQWILELEGEQYVTQLKNRSLKLEFDDQDKTVQFLEPTECELPSSWLSRTDTETRNQEHEKMEKDEAQKIAGGPLHYQYFQSQSQQPIITRDPSTGQCYMQNASGIWLPVSDEYIQHAQYNNQPPQPPPKTSTEPVFDGSQTEILVEDIPDGVDEEILEMYFSSKTLKQCSVKDVDFNEVERNAVIRFESPEDVKRVLDNRPIKVEKMEVTVQIYVPKKLCSIIVRGPKEIMKKENKDIIEMYFENENKSKGGDIADIDFRSKEHAYYIRFKEEDVARRVVNRGGHRLKGKELTVELFTPSRSPKQAANETDMDTDDSKANHGETDSKPGKTVKVRGVKDVSDMETIEWYFGTKRKSGGGEIAKTYMDDTDPDIIYIEYTDENVANDVVDRQHNLEGHTLDVTLFDRQDHENSRAIDHDSVFAGTEILVEDIPLGIHKDLLEMCFSSGKFNACTVENVDFDEVTKNAVIKFEKPGDVKTVLSNLPIKIKEKELSVQMYVPKQLNTIIARGPTEIMKEKHADKFEMYFEDEKKSGGGVISEIDMRPKENTVYVTFENGDVAKRVVNRGGHRFMNTNITVELLIPSRPTQSSSPGRNKIATAEDVQSKEFSTEILVENIPSGVDKDYLGMFFSSKRLASCQVEDVDFNETEMSAVITFRNHKDVKTVLENLPITIKKQDVSVHMYIPKKLDTIIVRGPKEVMKKNNIAKFRMYFENKKSGGGDIAECNFRPKEHALYISFYEENAAKRVANRGGHRLMNKDITVELLIPSRSTKSLASSHNTEENFQSQTETDQECLSENNSTKILVGDIPSGVDTDYLEMAFSSKKFGLCTVKDVDFNENEMNAVITFGSHEDVVIVLENLPITIKEKELSVQIFIPKTLDTIIVRGPKVVMKEENMDAFMMYFENKKSGGGDIAECNFRPQEHEFFITFAEENVAKRVVDRGGHRCMNHDISVSLDSPSRSTQSSKISNFSEESKLPGCVLDEEKKNTKSVKTIKVRGVNKVSNRESVLWYFENKKAGGAEIEKRYTDDEDDDVLYIEYKDETDMAKLEEVSKSTPLEGSYLKFSTVPISSSVLVSNIDDFTNDTVMLYFETTKRSNGGPVKTVQMLKGYSIVDFMDYKVVDNVLSTNHKLDGREFEVRRYFPCIGRAEGDAVERRFKKPSPFKLKTDVHKMQFLTRFKAYKNEGEKRLAICHAAIDWPLHPDVNEIEISCTLSEEVKYCVKLANDWQINAAASFDDFINTYVVARVFVVHEILESVNEEVSKRKIIDIDEVMLQNEENNIYIVGKKESVININKIVQEIVKQKQEDMERKKAWSSVKIQNLKQIETKMFSVHQFPRQMEEKYPGSKVLICEEKNEIEIEGINNIVNQIQLDLYILKETFKETNMSITNETEAIFMSSSFKQHIDKKCEEKKVLVVWEANKGKLYVMSQNEEMLMEAVEIVYKSVTTGILSLAPESMALLQSHQWKDIHQRLQSDHHGKVSIETTSDKIRLAGTDDIYNVVLQTIKDFLDTNTIYVDKWSFAKNVQEFLVQYYLQDMQNIAKSNNATFRAHTNGFEISSTKNGIQSIKTELESLAKKVQKTQHLISKPGSPDFMNSAKGQNILKSVANSHQVLIVSGEHESDDDHGIYDQDPNAVNLPSGCSVMAACTGYGKRNMYAVVCDMTDLNVDVLVNSSDDTINLHSGLGQALLSKGGSRIEKDCQKYIAAHGKLTETAVHMSTAGHLNAKCIIHVSGPQWKGGSNKEG